MNQHYELDASVVHKTWNKGIEPRLTIESGDTISFGTRDAADLYYSPTSVSEDIEKRGPFVGHPLTGPVFVRDAVPGDVLAIEVRAMEFTSNFGCTAVRKGRGLLPDRDVRRPGHLWGNLRAARSPWCDRPGIWRRRPCPWPEEAPRNEREGCRSRWQTRRRGKPGRNPSPRNRRSSEAVADGRWRSHRSARRADPASCS